MTSPGGNQHPLPIGAFLSTAILAVLICSAAGAIEGAVRAAFMPLLYDTRLDAASYVLWAIAANTLWGVVAGIGSAIILQRAFGALPAAFVPGAWLASAWALHQSLRDSLGNATAAWIGIGLGLVVAIGVTTGLSRVRATLGLAAGRRMPLGFLRAASVPILISLAVAGWFAGRGLIGRPRAPLGASSVVLITVDTLRADALGSFRDRRPHLAELDKAATPRLDALASEGVRFVNASTPLPKTPEAVASLMTGLYPERHGLRNLFRTLDPATTTVAEVLRAAGWVTRAVTTNLLIGRWSGVAQGFDRFQGKAGLRGQVTGLSVVDLLDAIAPWLIQRELNRFESLRSSRETAGETTTRALGMLGEIQGGPFFLWVHYLDPHWPYWPPQPFRDRVDPAPGTPFPLYEDVAEGHPPIGEVVFRNRLPRETNSRAFSLYAGEVGYTDDEIGKLVDAVRARPGGDSTIIVVTADHGEGLGEHDFYFSHGAEVYDSSLRIPLIIAARGKGRGASVSSNVSLVDLCPTILEMAGAPIPPGVEGISLVPLLGGGSDAASRGEFEERPVYSESDLAYRPENPFIRIPGESGKLRAIRIGPYKMIRFPRDIEAARRFDPELGAENRSLVNPLGLAEATILGASEPDRVELFDLGADPGETRDIHGSKPMIERAMAALIDERILSRNGGSGPIIDLTPDLIHTIRSLGYVDSGGASH